MRHEAHVWQIHPTKENISDRKAKKKKKNKKEVQSYYMMKTFWVTKKIKSARITQSWEKSGAISIIRHSSDEHWFRRQRPRFDFGSNPSYLCDFEQDRLISLILSFFIWKMGLIIICRCWCHGICCDVCLICLLSISSPSFCTNGSPLSYWELFQYNPSGTTQLISIRVSGCHDLFTLKTFRIPSG